MELECQELSLESRLKALPLDALRPLTYKWKTGSRQYDNAIVKAINWMRRNGAPAQPTTESIWFDLYQSVSSVPLLDLPIAEHGEVFAQVSNSRLKSDFLTFRCNVRPLRFEQS